MEWLAALSMFLLVATLSYLVGMRLVRGWERLDSPQHQRVNLETRRVP